ncbi:MAG: Cof-type HAD-IIB family hydrolase [Sphaerochaetaceae bacterium]|nr:Cof-type HAD-IIB family hydrolase [Sphaerochaetaceae bacterium]
MKTKYLFYDIDGTLFPFGLDAPESAVEALRKAHENGHKLFLSTGRSPAEVDPRLHRIYFDGGIYCGGALAYVGDEEIFASVFSTEQVREIIEIGEERGWQMLFQTRSRSVISRELVKTLTALFIKSYGRALKIENLVEVEKYPVLDDVTKVCFWTPDNDVASIREMLKGRFDVIDNTMGIPLECSAEIVLPGQSKSVGLKAILDYYKEDISSSIAFGDGANDIEIIRDAGIGVAMGNATDNVKAVADYVTDDILLDGLAKAMKHFGVY